MRHRSLILLGLATLAFASSAAAQDTRPGIAVLPFMNGGSYGQEKENFEALQQGIPGMLISELSNNPAARLVERDKIQDILREQDLAKDGRIDAATAAKIGKLVQARYVITGTFTDLYGKFRMDIRIFDGETSVILKSFGSLGKREEMFKQLQSLAERLMAETQLPPLALEVSQAVKARNVPTEALTYYSRALLYQDRGDKAKAADFFSKAIDVFPGYAEAEAGLKKVRAS